MTSYDELVQDKNVQMIKNILPFMDSTMQVSMALLIHYLELQNSLKELQKPTKAICSCEIPEGSSRQVEMLKAIKPCCNAREQEFIENLLNCLCIMENLTM